MLKKKTFAFLGTFAVIGLWSATAFAADGASANGFSMFAWFAMSAGFGIGIAAFGGAYGQGQAASAALEGIARNPNASDEIFTPLILALALIESLVIYALLIAFLLWLKIDVTALALGG